MTFKNDAYVTKKTTKKNRNCGDVLYFIQCYRNQENVICRDETTAKGNNKTVLLWL